MQSSSRVRGLVAMVALSGLFLAACASTGPVPRIAGRLTGFRLTGRDILSVRVDAAPSVEILPAQKRRMAQDISDDIRGLQSADAASGAWRPYEIAVHITRYSVGGGSLGAAALGRSRGLIGARVQVFSLPQHRLEEAFTLNQGASRGGFFGASDSQGDTERVFVEDVARALMGRWQGSRQQPVGLAHAGEAPSTLGIAGRSARSAGAHSTRSTALASREALGGRGD